MAFSFKLIVAILCAFAALAQAAAGDLIMIQKEEIAANVQQLPRPDRFQLELGKLLAAQMGRSLLMLDLPRKRYARALETGEADLVCGLLPAWMPAEVDWSKPFIPVVDVVLSAARVPAPKSIKDLKGKRVGTDTGFKYPEMEQELGSDFIRDDGTSADSALRKMAAGRFDYMISTLALYVERKKAGTLQVSMNPPMPIAEYKTHCAVSRHGRVTVQDIDKAVESLLKGSALTSLLARNRSE